MNKFWIYFELKNKNFFIIATTLISRAAIEGGLNIEEALSLSDLYIQKFELVHNTTELRPLNMEMVKDYTTKVHIIRGDKESSKFILEFSNYIVKNISKKITVEDVTKNFYISKTSLASKIKEETGMTLIDFINYKKIEVSKDLLKKFY